MTDQTNTSRDCGEDTHSRGFFFPMLVIPLGIALTMGMVHAKRRHFRGHMGRQWENGVPPMFAEWHRRAHAAEAAGQSQSA